MSEEKEERQYQIFYQYFIRLFSEQKALRDLVVQSNTKSTGPPSIPPTPKSPSCHLPQKQKGLKCKDQVSVPAASICNTLCCILYPICIYPKKFKHVLYIYVQGIIYMHVCIYIYIYNIYACVCICVCVCTWDIEEVVQRPPCTKKICHVLCPLAQQRLQQQLQQTNWSTSSPTTSRPTNRWGLVG